MFARTNLVRLGLFGAVRRYASVASVAGGPEASILVRNSIDQFRDKLEKKEYSGFQFELLSRHFSKDFFANNQTHFNKCLNGLEKNLAKKCAEQIEVNESALLNSVPTSSNYLQYVRYLIENKQSLQQLPLEVSTEVEGRSALQRTVDRIVERIIYSEMKPFNLQHVYNDASNNQNFNNNLTFNIIDIANPYEWFPEARKLKRKFIMHVGPTNSGKTYNALKRLENCSKGYFAGPLRLLAREVYDKFQAKEMRCNLVTGEEVIVDIDEYGNKAGLTSGTIEMLPMSENFDVVVVDEIQMIGDIERGSAWTNVILGARAKEIHLCGEVSAVPLIKKLVAMTGDDIEIHEYNRLGKLVVDESEVVLERDVMKGDCVVCFSKNLILDTKAKIEQETNLRCAVIYGALPPETRAQEARRFNEGYYDVVVASDAIGMGLNLKINRVIFTTTKKFNGHENVELTYSNIKQIGGRAGRFGVGESVGHITATSDSSLANVKQAIEAPIQYLEKAVLWPPDALWVKYYSMFSRGTDLISMFRKFEADVSKFHRENANDTLFEMQSLKEKKTMTMFFEKQRLNNNFNILDQLKFISCFSPLQTRKSPMKLIIDDVFKEFITTVIKRRKRSLFDYKSLPLYLTSTEHLLKKKEINNELVSVRTDRIESDPIPEGLKPELLKEVAKMDHGVPKPRKQFVKHHSSVEDRLMKLESFHKLVGSYLWLSYRFPQNFVNLEVAVKLKELIEFKISEMLTNLRASPSSDAKKHRN